MLIKDNTRAHYTVCMIYQKYLKYNKTFRTHTDVR